MVRTCVAWLGIVVALAGCDRGTKAAQSRDPSALTAQPSTPPIAAGDDAELFKHLKTLCIDTRADPTKVRLAAQAEGLRLTYEAPERATYVGWDFILETDVMDIAATPKTPAAIAHQCRLQAPGKNLGWARAMHEWLGLAPSKRVDADEVRYHIRLDSKGPQRLESDDLEAIGKAIRAHAYAYLAVGQDSEYAAFLFYSAAPAPLDAKGRPKAHGNPPRWNPEPGASPDYLPGTRPLAGAPA